MLGIKCPLPSAKARSWEFLPEGHAYLGKREKETPSSSKAAFLPFTVNVSDSDNPCIQVGTPQPDWRQTTWLSPHTLAETTAVIPASSLQAPPKAQANPGSFSFFFPLVVQRSERNSPSPVTTVFVCAGASGFPLPLKAEVKNRKKSFSQGILGSSKVRRFQKQNRGTMR